MIFGICSARFGCGPACRCGRLINLTVYQYYGYDKKCRLRRRWVACTIPFRSTDDRAGPMIANDRKHMVAMIDDWMGRSRKEVRALNADATHVKTYMIEAAIRESAKPRETRSFVKGVIARTALR